MKLTSIFMAMCCALFSGVAFGQGADDCASAQAITGPGTYNFDNTVATMDGVPDPLCLAFALEDIDYDVWFSYTAASTATVTLEACTQTTVDTKIAAYDGACGGAILACNDDTCGLQSQISFGVTVGNVYLLRIGTFPGAVGGVGTFTVVEGGGGGGGGNDDCNSPTAISGDGVFLVDNTAGTGLDADPACALFGSDVWYAWTAATAGVVTMDLCDGTTGYDSALAAWDGPSGCPTSLITCNDDSCGLQSAISFPVTAGTLYMIQVGGYNGATGTGNLTIVTGTAGSNDSCTTPEVISGQGSFNYDNTLATLDGNGDPLCLKFSTDQIQKDVWFEWTADATGTATMETCNGGTHDTKIAAYDGAGCPTGSPLDCNDDTCALLSQITFSVVNGNVYMLRLGSFSSTGGVGFFDLDIQGGGGGSCVDSVYCSSLPNSTGATAGMAWAGSCVVADNNFTLLASNGPGGQPGLFIYGANQASIPFGNGVLCISAPILRLNPPVFMDGSGAASKVVDLANPPSSSGTITAGSTWNFQMWERDPAAGGAGYTFTDGLSVTFQ